MVVGKTKDFLLLGVGYSAVARSVRARFVADGEALVGQCCWNDAKAAESTMKAVAGC